MGINSLAGHFFLKKKLQTSFFLLCGGSHVQSSLLPEFALLFLLVSTLLGLHWDMASIHASEATLAAMKAAFPLVLCFIPPRSTSHAWTTGWHRLRAGSNAEFREAVAEAAALHSRDDLFSRHIQPEPAPEDPVDWAMAEASDDEDDAPMPDLIDMPPAPVSARPMSNLERCIALRLLATRRSHRPKKNCPCIISLRPSVVSHVRCPVCPCSKCPAQAPRQ